MIFVMKKAEKNYKIFFGKIKNFFRSRLKKRFSRRKAKDVVLKKEKTTRYCAKK